MFAFRPEDGEAKTWAKSRLKDSMPRVTNHPSAKSHVVAGVQTLFLGVIIGTAACRPSPYG